MGSVFKSFFGSGFASGFDTGFDSEVFAFGPGFDAGIFGSSAMAVMIFMPPVFALAPVS
jgi:hypothetical protein